MYSSPGERYMHVPKRQIFRESALQHYIRNREKDVLLRILPVPMAIFLWVLLSILFMAGLFAWNARIPTYVNGAGIVQESSAGNSIGVVFLPTGPSTIVQVGESVQIQVGANGPQIQGFIMEVEPDIMSPESTRNHFQLEGDNASLVTQPAQVVLVRFRTTVPATTYAGSSLSAQIEVGSQRILSQLPWIGQLIGN
jgi:hypothetical protein